jgi:hypothetical protein
MSELLTAAGHPKYVLTDKQLEKARFYSRTQPPTFKDYEFGLRLLCGEIAQMVFNECQAHEQEAIKEAKRDLINWLFEPCTKHSMQDINFNPKEHYYVYTLKEKVMYYLNRYQCPDCMKKLEALK